MTRSSTHRTLGTVIATVALVAFGTFAAFGVTGRLSDLLPCDPAPGSSCTRILFVGNSYTFVNDLPDVFRQLAGSGGHQVETGMVATGGATLAGHVSSADAIGTIGGSRWRFVVLQEQSEIPSVERLRQQEMYPAVRSLAGSIRQRGAEPLLFETWAHRDGWSEYGLDYGTMQAQIDAGYQAIGGELGAIVAPVGQAWLTASRDPQLNLWQADGSHPTEAGTYLAACVLYATVFSRSPEGLGYSAGLSPGAVLELQKAAARVVLGGGDS